MSATLIPGERFEQMLARDPMRDGSTGIWTHLGWRRVEVTPGRQVLEWEPTVSHSFPAGEGWIVHGGMVTAIIDTAMGGAAWSLLNLNEVFLTADLRTEFYRPTFPGLVKAVGWVVHKTRRVTYCAGELFDSDGKLLAGGRATQMIIDVSNIPDAPRQTEGAPDRG